MHVSSHKNIERKLKTNVSNSYGIVNTMIGNFRIGGIHMMHMESYFASLRASWVIRLVSRGMDNWKLIPYKYFRQFGKNWLIFSMNIDYKKIKIIYDIFLNFKKKY